MPDAPHPPEAADRGGSPDHGADGGAPPAPPRSLSESVGGVLGIAESVLPPTAFVVAYLLVGQEVRTAAIAAGAIAVVLAAARLVRGQTLQFALSGLIGIAIAAFVVARTGRPEDFFLPSLLWNVGYGTALLISLAVRWPLVGVIIGSLRQDPTGWRADPARRALYTKVTWLWVGLFVARIVIKTPLYLAGSLVALGVVHIAMGVPLYLLGLWITWLLVRDDVGESRPASTPPVTEP